MADDIHPAEIDLLDGTGDATLTDRLRDALSPYSVLAPWSVHITTTTPSETRTSELTYPQTDETAGRALAQLRALDETAVQPADSPRIILPLGTDDATELLHAIEATTASTAESPHTVATTTRASPTRWPTVDPHWRPARSRRPNLARN